MARYKYQGTWADGNGRRIDSATVSVYLAGTDTPADVYIASAGGSAVNSVTTDSTSLYKFWLDDGDYTNTQLFKITMSKSSFQPKTIDDIAIIQNPNVVDTLNPQDIAGLKTFKVGPIIETAAPRLKMHESGVTTDNSKWHFQIDAEKFNLIAYSDDELTSGVCFQIDRTETTVDLFNILSTDLQHNGLPIAVTGQYNPISSNLVNAAAVVIVNNTNYYRIGNLVTVSGHLNVDPSVTATLTTWELTIPISSSFTNFKQAHGSAELLGNTANVVDAFRIEAVASTNRVKFSGYPIEVADSLMTFSFTYEIL